MHTPPAGYATTPEGVMAMWRNVDASRWNIASLFEQAHDARKHNAPACFVFEPIRVADNLDVRAAAFACAENDL